MKVFAAVWDWQWQLLGQVAIDLPDGLSPLAIHNRGIAACRQWLNERSNERDFHLTVTNRAVEPGDAATLRHTYATTGPCLAEYTTRRTL